MGRISDGIKCKAYALLMLSHRLSLMRKIERQFRIFLLDLLCSSTRRRMRGDMWHDMMDVHDMPGAASD